MDGKVAGLLGIMGLATLGSAHAASAPPNQADALHAASYADLLTPVPDAVAALQADDAARAENPPRVELAQYNSHHHHHYRRRRHHYHHHYDDRR